MKTEEIIRRYVDSISDLLKYEFGRGADPDEVALSNALVTNVCALLAQALVDLNAIAEAARATQSPPIELVHKA